MHKNVITKIHILYFVEFNGKPVKQFNTSNKVSLKTSNFSIYFTFILSLKLAFEFLKYCSTL